MCESMSVVFIGRRSEGGSFALGYGYEICNSLELFTFAFRIGE